PPGPALLNFERSTFRVDENTHTARVFVMRSGGDRTKTVSVQYRIDHNSGANDYNTFPLQAGSEYATPNVDFDSVTGTLTFPANPNSDPDVQSFDIPITQDNITEFNEDMILQ